jgi:glycosyltransferase involved in cell wall biosynthesis
MNKSDEIIRSTWRNTLTIGVPTFNRASELRKLLTSIERENFFSDVEILVSDNASQDDTQTVLTYFSGKIKNLRILINQKNLGFDGNILSLYQQATGKYIWFLSDDDCFLPGSIEKIIAYLLAIPETSLVNVAHQTKYGINLKEANDLIPYSSTGKVVNVYLGERMVFNPDDEEFRLHIILLASQISSCILLRGVDICDAGFGGGIMQSKLANYNLLNNPSYFMIADAVVISGAKTDYSSWFMDSVLFGTYSAYSDPRMKFSKAISALVGTQTCKVGLLLLKNRYEKAIPIAYRKVDQAFVEKLRFHYGKFYEQIAKDVDLALLAEKNYSYFVTIKAYFNKVLSKLYHH